MANLQDAVARLDALDALRVDALSSVYETEPVGEVTDQRDFLNAVARVETGLDPIGLLDACKEIEREMGRTAGPRHGPRPIDVDVLIVQDEVLVSERLSLPHPEVRSRRFVLVPLLEVDPPGADGLRAALQGLAPGQRVERVGELELLMEPAPE